MDAFNASRAHFQGVEIDPNRQLELVSWLNEILPESPMRLSPASADASFRRYYRLEQDDTLFVVMDAPPENENTEPFQVIGKLLGEFGLPAPTIRAWQPERGFMLLEDFGNQTLLQVRRDEPELTVPLYQQAIDILLEMQALVPTVISDISSARASTYRLPNYDVALLETEMELFRQWLTLRHLGLSWSTRDEQEWRRTKDHLIASALAQPQVFVHRDYHSRNLMVRGLNERGADTQAADSLRLGVLDFQDAVRGPLFYDLVSLLKDCYATFDSSFEGPVFSQLLDYYFEQSTLTSLNLKNDTARRMQFHKMGVQRHLKAAGIFARLWHRDGKPAYLQDVPRTLGYVNEFCNTTGELSWLGNVTQRVLDAIAKKARAS